MHIAHHRIDVDAPVFVIAEAGVNHNGDLETARRLIDVATAAGADAVKFQTFSAGALVTRSAPKAAYQQRNDPSGQSQFEMLRGLELDEDAHRSLMEHCRRHELCFLSTPFDEASADMLERLGVPGFKVGSGEVTNLPLLRHLAGKRLPMILSTGMSDLSEVTRAVETIEAAGDPPLALMHCVSSYPADPAEANLRAIPVMARAFGRPVGWSDHTAGRAVALAAVALGACIIEKHFTLDRSMPGPDHKASLEPAELGDLIRDIRVVEAALGDGRKRCMPSERDTAKVARRSLVATCDIPSGTVLTKSMIGTRRPGLGLEPAEIERVVGRTTKQPVEAGAVLSWEMLA